MCVCSQVKVNWRVPSTGVWDKPRLPPDLVFELGLVVAALRGSTKKLNCMAQGVPILADLLVGGWAQGCWPGRPEAPGVCAGPSVGRARGWYEWLRGQGPRAGVVLLLYWAGFWGSWLRSPRLLEAGTSQLVGIQVPACLAVGLRWSWGWSPHTGEWSSVLGPLLNHWWVEPGPGVSGSRAWGAQNWCHPTGGCSCDLRPLLQGPGSPGVGVTHWWTSCGAPGVPELIAAHCWVLDPLVGGARSLGSHLIDIGYPRTGASWLMGGSKPCADRLEGGFQRTRTSSGVLVVQWAPQSGCWQVSPSFLLPLQEALPDLQVCLTQVPFRLLLLPWLSEHQRFRVHPFNWVCFLYPLTLP